MESGKRKYEADVSDGAIRSEKRTKISHETVTLLHLSDDVLILILRLLSSHDLLNLSYVCERFDRIAADETLWKIVDTRDSPLKVVIWYRKKYKIVWQHFKFHTIIIFFAIFCRPGEKGESSQSEIHAEYSVY